MMRSKFPAKLTLTLLEDRAVPAAFTVGNTSDDTSATGPSGSFRRALSDLSTSTDPTNSITFSPSLTGTLTLQASLPTISKAVTIQGLGAALLVDANQNAGFVVTDSANVTFNDLSISNAKSANDGGTLRVLSGNVTLNRVLFRKSESSTSGGAISLAAGNLTIQDSIFSENKAQSGGVLHVLSGNATVNRTLFLDANRATTFGGAVYAQGGSVSLKSTAIQNSSASFGGGVYAQDATVSVEGSSIFDSRADNEGGGIYFATVLNPSATLSVLNSTLASNRSTMNGGGVYVSAGTAIFANSTITANSAANGITTPGGGGVFVRSGASTKLLSTIVAGNNLGFNSGPPRSTTPGTFYGTDFDVSGALDPTSTKNLIGKSTGLTGISNGDANGNIVGSSTGIDPLLAAVSARNGFIQTYALQPNSPAIDKGSNPTSATSDNRGGPFVRSSGAGVDIGAFEVQNEIPLQVRTNIDRNNPTINLSDLSLREALRVAGSGASTITFAPSLSGKTINLTLGTLLVGDSVNISGSGANLLTVDGGGRSTILSYLTNFAGSVVSKVSGITLQNGFSGPAGLFSGGGAIYSGQQLTLDGVVVSNNRSATNGGGIASPNNLTIKNSTVSSNSAEGGSGGGVSFQGIGLTVSNSTFSANTATSDGGGIYVGPAFAGVIINNSTITLNQSDSDSASGGNGGGFFIQNTSPSADVKITSSIIAGNSTGTTGAFPDISGTAKASTLLVSDTSGYTPATGSDLATITTATPLLGPLANNGGPTPTHALLAGSPAIDLGANPDGLTTDQRGMVGARVFGPAADIGAFEFGVTVSPVPPAAPGSSVTSDFAVGLDQGGGTVTLYNQNQTVRLTLTPFEGFTGGIRTASADFNNDGITDVVVGTGPGIATQVKIISGLDQSVLFTINPFEAAFTRGVFVAAGDLNGDGTPDLAISPDEGGGPRVRIFSGQGFGQLADYFGIADPAFRGGARVTLGDMNSDGKAEVIVAAGFGGGPRVTIWDGERIIASNGNPEPSASLANFFAFETALRNGSYVAAGDVNGDGKADVVFGGGPGGTPRVRIFDGTRLVTGGFENLDSISDRQLANFFAGDVNDRSGARVAVKNLDNDGRSDLLAGGGPGSGARVTAYSATNFNSPLFTLDVQSGFTGGVYVG